MNAVSFLINLFIIMFPFLVLGFIKAHEEIRKLLGYSRIIILEKDGTATVVWKKVRSATTVKIGEKSRNIDPKGLFRSKVLGAFYVYLGDSPKPITTEDTEVKSELNVNDVSNMVDIAFFAGKLAGMKEFKLLKQMFYAIIGVGALVAVLLAMYWQDRTQNLQFMKTVLTQLKTLATRP